MKYKNSIWFPGHIKKAIDKIETIMIAVDVIINVIDSRAPITTSLDEFLLKFNKPWIKVASHLDLIGKEKNKSSQILNLNLKSQKSFNSLVAAIKLKAGEVYQVREKKGIVDKSINCLVIGLPNVGKSSLINLLARKKSTRVENRPGTTRGQQWIKANDWINVWDTPGILVKNNLTEKEILKLATLNIIPQENINVDELIDYLITSVISKQTVSNDFKQYDFSSSENFINSFALKRNLFLKSNILDIERAKSLFLSELNLGKVQNLFLD